MPFDAHTYPDSQTAQERRQRYRAAAWLFAVSFMIWGMVVLGGATRLTGSGLSIMEWAPLSGVLPPLSEHEWARLFALYKTIPQYALLHPGMDVGSFKGIFWLEWAHRAWGRLTGLVFLGGLAWFAWRGGLRRGMARGLLGWAALGLVQGMVGWFMVASGFLPDSTAVSPYRLVLHLSLALTLFAAVFWSALGLVEPVAESVAGAGRLRLLTRGTAILVGLTIVAGGFTAGLHAGLAYNSFPLMDGRLMPAGYGDLHPLLRNLTENVIAVQFDHRLLATVTALAVLATVFSGWRMRNLLPARARAALGCMGALVLVQYGLGVATLLSVVAIPLAAAHQASSVLLLASALAATHSLRGAKGITRN